MVVLILPAFKEGMMLLLKVFVGGVQDRTYLLFLSRIHEKKGTDLLVKAYKKMALNKGLDLPALVIAGPGAETSFGNKIIQLVAGDEILRKNVFFLAC
jgi:glycosyltransferase involved in cell wall biosynthesis